MADIRTPPPPTPASWGEAFAALPAEAPPRDGWQRVARQLAARRRARLPAWAGLAAAAGLLLAVGLWAGLRPPAPTPASPVAAPDQRVASQPAGSVPATPDATPDPATAAIDDDPVASPATRPAATATQVATTADPSRDTTTIATTTPEDALAPLQQESAHLEALLALARDDSVGSAGAVLLADAFDARLAGIDALLANPGLAGDERAALWRERVDTLRQAAGFVSTQRLLAVQGHGDAWLASVD